MSADLCKVTPNPEEWRKLLLRMPDAVYADTQEIHFIVAVKPG